MQQPYQAMMRREKYTRLLAAGGFIFSIAAVAAFVIAYAVTQSAQTVAAAPAASQAAAAASAFNLNAFNGVILQAKSAIVIDLSTHRTLFSLNPDAQLPLASLTKIAMALSVSEVLRPDDVITIPYDTAPTHTAGPLYKGEQFRERDLMDFTLVASSNEGADILAAAADKQLHEKYPLSPSGSATLWRMNDIAKQLGLVNTFFLNDNGLDISTTQSGGYGSARDVALLLADAASSSRPVFEATTEQSISISSLDGREAHASNTDDALPAIQGIVMGKTGYTDLAGGNLAVVFNVGMAHPIAIVVLGSTFKGRFDDMRTLVSATEQAITGAGQSTSTVSRSTPGKALQ